MLNKCQACNAKGAPKMSGRMKDGMKFRRIKERCREKGGRIIRARVREEPVEMKRGRSRE